MQNMVGGEMFRNVLGYVPGGITTRLASKAASLLYAPAEQRVRGLLAQSMIDPKLAQELLAAEIKKRPDLMKGLLGLRNPIYSGGILGAGSAQ